MRSETEPDSTNDEVGVTVNGVLVSTTSRTGIMRTYGHDALERQTGMTDPRTGTSVTHYNDKGQVDWIEDAAINRTSFAYDADTGRQISVTDALTNTVWTAHDVQGRATNAWGATYPVAYAFDDYGRMGEMRTWRDTNSAPDVTQWLYDEATGLLTNKLYADGKGPSYSYTPDGKMATRAWARGVLTTYIYTNTTGEMIGIDYSDSTPDVTFSFDRLGRQVTITDGQGTRSFGYDEYLALTNETIIADGVTNVIARLQDSLGRSAGLHVGPDLVSAPYSVSYAYNALGRFSSIASVVDGVTNGWQYSYLANSDLIEKTIEPGAGVTNGRNYEANRDLITEVHNQAQGVTISKYQHQNDALGRRTQRIDTTANVTTNNFLYNPRSELTNAVIGERAYGWAFDNIGNRQTYTTNGTVFTYLANELNQYANIQNAVTNSFTWDVDGNLLADGTFSNTWDGENRLIAVQPINPATGSRKVELAYDYMGRRYRKITSAYNGSSWDVTGTNLWVYDAWLPVCEVGRGVSAESFCTNWWIHGLDLSGSLQGAGGIGGLLSWTRSSEAKTFFYFADGNGNITELTEAGDPTNVVAQYQWDAYGNPISTSGTEATNNVFRWSSKYIIVETGDYDFGYRILRDHRFTSRDPIDELAFGFANPHLPRRRTISGDPLYILVRNAPVNGFDALGLDWKIGRKKEETAVAEVVSISGWPGRLLPGSTVRELAEKIGLSASEYQQWLVPDDGARVPVTVNVKLYCRRFKIPNTVVAYWADTVSKAAYGWDASVQHLTRLGFIVDVTDHVPKTEGVLTDKLNSASAKKTLHGVYYFGHGVQAASVTATQLWYLKERGGRDVVLTGWALQLKYKMALGLVYSCYSLNSDRLFVSRTKGYIYWGYPGDFLPAWYSDELRAWAHIKSGDQGTN